MTQMKLENITLNYGDRIALQDVSSVFEGGRVVALVGPNGAGKSTLLKACAGLLEPKSGIVSIDDQNIEGLSLRTKAKRIAYLPPDGRSAWPMSAKRIVALGRVPHLKPLSDTSHEDDEAISQALDQAGVEHLADRAFNTLSSGERARVLIARALATRADIMLLDEPTAALDPQHQLAVMELLKAEAKRGALIVMAVHALELVAKYADQVLVLKDGQLKTDGPPATSLSEDMVRDVFGIIAPGGIKPTDLAIAD
jgi:iron complex transport system ATP-binding protein